MSIVKHMEISFIGALVLSAAAAYATAPAGAAQGSTLSAGKLLAAHGSTGASWRAAKPVLASQR